MGMRIIPFAIFIILLFSCKEDDITTPTNDPQDLNIISIDAVDKIEIVTWNVENFPKSDHADEYLEQFIEGLYADVYLFQEIQNINKFDETMGSVESYNYFVNNSSSSIEYGIVYKKNTVSLLNTTEILKDSAYYFASRPPFLVEIEWEQNGVTKNISLINVHYKCCGNDTIKYEQNDDGSWDEEFRRLKSSQLLYDYLNDNLSDRNVIIAGDWNDAIEEPQETNVFQVFLDDNANFQFVDMDIAQGSADNWSWPGWSSSYPAIHFDHILINRNLFDEYVNNSVVSTIKVEEYFENGNSDYDTYLSDHRPVYLQFSP